MKGNVLAPSAGDGMMDGFVGRTVSHRLCTCVQVVALRWWKVFSQERLGVVEVVRSDGRAVKIQYPRMPFCQPKYLSSSTRDRFLWTVDRSTEMSKREGLLAAVVNVEVRPRRAGGGVGGWEGLRL